MGGANSTSIPWSSWSERIAHHARHIWVSLTAVNAFGVLSLTWFHSVIGQVAFYIAIRYVSLSDSTVVTFLAPITSGIAGRLFLKEHFGIKQIIAGGASMLGVIMIARPSSIFGSEHGDSSTGISPDGGANAQERIMAIGYVAFPLLFSREGEIRN